MAQRYTQPLALERLAAKSCPECGYRIYEHDGWGGPNGCSLTDNGVAQRIYDYEQEARDDRAR